MKDGNTRTGRDHDIIKQSSLKAAVDLMTAMLPTLDNKTEISDMTLKLATKFNTWVLDGKDVEGEVRNIKEQLERDHPEQDGEEVPRYRRKNTYKDREAGGTVWADGGPQNLPLTAKQRGFIIGLHNKIGHEPDYYEIDQLTIDEASNYINDLKAMAGENGNGRSQRRG